jgi:photosystem II stability/assembly factor-like uncharacterized protein
MTQSYPISGIALISAISGYVLTQGSKASVLYFTQDSGKSWQKLSTVCQGTLFSPTIRFFDNRQGIIIGCTKGKLVGFITADGGKTWQTENIFSKSCITFLTRDGKTLTIMNFIDNNYYVLVRE